MPFTEEVREHLLNLDLDRWSAELLKMVPKYGKTMEASAREAFDAGLIDRRHYLVYAHGTKAEQERKDMQEQDKAAERGVGREKK